MIEQYYPVFDEADKKAVADVIGSGWVNEGKLTQEFERRFAEAVDTKYAVACANGTLALYMALKVISPFERIVIPATANIGDVRALEMANLSYIINDVGNKTPVLHEINEDGLPLAISINGYYDEWWDDCGVEDACQSIGSRQYGKQIGTFSEIGCFSLATSKIITSGQGGVCVTNSEQRYHDLLAFKDQGRQRDYSAKTQSPRYLLAGTNLKFDDIKAALALSQMDKLYSRIIHKFNVTKIYEEILGDDMMPREVGELPWYPMLNLNTSKHARDNPAKRNIGYIISRMADCGIQLKQFPETVSTQMGRTQAYPNADAFHEYCAYLPCAPDLSLDEADIVAHELKKVI